MRGYCTSGKVPSLVRLSLWQMPQAWTLIRTNPGPGSGISRSTISKGAFGRVTCTTRILGITPPLRFLGNHQLHQQERTALAAHQAAVFGQVNGGGVAARTGGGGVGGAGWRVRRDNSHKCAAFHRGFGFKRDSTIAANVIEAAVRGATVENLARTARGTGEFQLSRFHGLHLYGLPLYGLITGGRKYSGSSTTFDLIISSSRRFLASPGSRVLSIS